MGSRTSPYLQEAMVLLGCEQVYGDVPPLLERLLGIKVNTSQVYRSTLAVSEAMDSQKLNKPSTKLSKACSDPDRTVYAMVDGSMLFLDGGWQEVKVGRVFTSTSVGEKDGGNAIDSSEYTAHRGHYKGFTAKFEGLLPPKSKARTVFVTDGAAWISNWISSTCPSAVQVLDFFHVAEKLGGAATECKAKEGWLEKQKEQLKKGKFQTVRRNVSGLKWKDPDRKRKLLAYMDKNRYRMAYDEYLREGLMIGSGPVESAHRTVLQKRMKLSGQRWGEAGGDKMIDLRVAVMSEKSHLISEVFRNAA
jgi:hypothetical protein